MKNIYEILTLVISFVGIASVILDGFLNDGVYIIFKLKII